MRTQKIQEWIVERRRLQQRSDSVENSSRDLVRTADDLAAKLRAFASDPIVVKHFIDFALPPKKRAEAAEVTAKKAWAAAKDDATEQGESATEQPGKPTKRLKSQDDGRQKDTPVLSLSQHTAKAMADSIADVLRRDSNSFADVAKEVSDDPTAAQNGGDTGFFPDMGMVWPFNQAVLTGYMGEIKVVETVFGYHVIEVIAKKGFNKKIRVAVINRAIEPSSQTYQDYWTMASKFAAETDSPEAFESAINNLGLRKRNMPSLTKATNFIPEIEYPRTMVRWAFNEETEIGSISEIFDMDGNYVVAMLTKIDEAGTQSFESVRDLVFAQVNKLKKAEYIREQVKGLNTMADIASKMGVTIEPVDVNLSTAVINLYGLEPEVVGQAFGLGNGEISEVIQGNGAVYIVNTLGLKDPENTSSIELTKAQMQAYFANRVRNNMIMTALENAAEIEDNRHSFY